VIAVIWILDRDGGIDAKRALGRAIVRDVSHLLRNLIVMLVIDAASVAGNNDSFLERYRVAMARIVASSKSLPIAIEKMITSGRPSPFESPLAILA
jgi:hypothetical protein